MRVVSWNYQGLGSTLTVQVLKGHVEKYDPDIVFLMETKNNKEVVEKVRRRMKFVNGMTMDPNGLSGGLALWWKEDINVQMMVSSKNLIDTYIVFQGCEMGCRVFWVYGAPVYEERKAVWDVIKGKARYIQGAWMCIGDFNDILLYSEKQGGRLKKRERWRVLQKW